MNRVSINKTIQLLKEIKADYEDKTIKDSLFRVAEETGISPGTFYFIRKNGMSFSVYRLASIVLLGKDPGKQYKKHKY